MPCSRARRHASTRPGTPRPAATRPGSRCTRRGRRRPARRPRSWSNSGAQRPGQRPDRAGDQHGLVAGRPVLADPAYGGGRERGPARASVRYLVGDRVEVGQVGRRRTRGRSRAGSALRSRALGPHQARQPAPRSGRARRAARPAVELAAAASTGRSRSRCDDSSVPSMSKNAATPVRRSASTLRSARGSAGCLRRAPAADVEPAHRRGDRRAVHLAEVVVPVDDRGVEGEGARGRRRRATSCRRERLRRRRSCSSACGVLRGRGRGSGAGTPGAAAAGRSLRASSRVRSLRGAWPTHVVGDLVGASRW